MKNLRQIASIPIVSHNSLFQLLKANHVKFDLGSCKCKNVEIYKIEGSLGRTTFLTRSKNRQKSNCKKY